MDIGEYLRDQLKDSINQQFHIEGDIWLVPCVANYIENDFKPLLRPLTCNYLQEQQLNRQGWTSIEDEILLKIVSSRGAKAWSGIAKELNAMIHDGAKVRQGRHCRERWYNHVDPGLIKGNWSTEEDDLLIKLHSELGNRWSEISKRMKGRTENSVKNRFKSMVKKKGIPEELNESKTSKEESSGIDKSKNEQNDALMLMSPQIVNFDISDGVESRKFEQFFAPRPMEIRPIRQRPPNASNVNSTKESLRREALLEGTPSPSIFLR
jgi:hypothetical protein